MAVVSVQIDNYSLQSSKVVASTISHDSGPVQALNLLKISRRDGQKLISSTYNPKKIMLAGTIKGATQAELEANIDEFKRKTSVTTGSLDIAYAGAFRRYTVALESAVIERRGYHLTHCPFSISFTANDPPFGRKVSGLGGNLVVDEALSVQQIAASQYETTITFDGSANPRPIITYVIDTVGGLVKTTFRNKTTNQEISVGTSWSAGDQVVIDTDGNTVRRAGVDVDFTGVFPEFDLGANNVLIILSDSTSLNQQQVLQDSDADTQAAYLEEAQSFQVGSSTNYDKFEVLLKTNDTSMSDSTPETFDTTTKKDGANTTGDWDTGASVAMLANTGVATSDQSQTGGDGRDDLPVPTSDFDGLHVYEFTKLAQSFTPAGSALMPRATVRAKTAGSPTGNLVVTIQTDSGNKPSGTILATQNIDITTWSASYATRTINFTNPPALASGTKYWLVLDASGSGFSKSKQIYWDYVTAGAYTGGSAKYNMITDGVTEDWPVFNSELVDFVFNTFYYPLTAASNVIQSLGFDTQNTVNVFQTSSSTTVLNSCTVTLEWSDSANNSSWSAWTQNIAGLSQRYIRFRITITGGSSTQSAFIYDVAFTYKSKVRLTLYNTSGGLPTTSIATVEVYVDTIGSSYTFVPFIFSPVQALTAGTTYAFSIRPTGTQTIKWGFKNADVYSNGQRVRLTTSGGTWVAVSTNDMSFKIYKQQTVNWSVDAKVTYTERYL